MDPPIGGPADAQAIHDYSEVVRRATKEATASAGPAPLQVADTVLREDDGFDALSYGPIASRSFRIAVSIAPFVSVAVQRWLAVLQRIRSRLREVLDQLNQPVEPGVIHRGSHELLSAVVERKRGWLNKNMEAMVTALALIGADFGAGPNPLAEDIGRLLDAYGDCRASPKALMQRIKKLKMKYNEDQRDRKVKSGTPEAQAAAEEKAANQATDAALGNLEKNAPSYGMPVDNR